MSSKGTFNWHGEIDVKLSFLMATLKLFFLLFVNVHHLQILQFQIVLFQLLNMLLENVHHLQTL